jgi:hypothetical protein
MSMKKVPLYVFDLPKPLLDTLAVKGYQEIPVQEEDVINSADEVPPELATAKATTCTLCDFKFHHVDEQRQHVKSDLHKYNLKLKVKGLNAVTESEFEKLIGDLDESISGSDSSDNEDSEDEKSGSNMLASLLKKQANLNAPEEDDDSTSVPKVSPGSALIWLKSPNYPENTSLGVYKVLFSQAEQVDLVNTLRVKQLAPITIAHTKNKAPTIPLNSPKYFLCMTGGGHFAAIIVALAPRLSKHATERQPILLAHKTFHRYTTRRKQGGSQSANDAAKGAAHSAGANIRRANEAALNTEVRALLEEWKPQIDACELIFVRATGSQSRRTLFGPYDGQVLSTKDVRNRGFPFTTRRATQSELMRAFVELTQVKISEIDEAALRLAASKPIVPKAKPAPKPVVKLSPEEEEQLLHVSQLTALVKRAKIPALLAYIKSNNIDVNKFTLTPSSQYHHTPTILHFASSLGVAPMITSLLTKAGADPTIESEEGKTAAEISRDRPVRDAFRGARHQLGEKAFNWDKAGVGSPLSPAEAAVLAEKDRQAAEEEKKREAERRQKAVEQLKIDEEHGKEAKAEYKFGKGYSMAKPSKIEQESIGMTPQLRQRLERERRARAAEERMKRLAGGS